jgi:hypothetical protein
METSTLKPRMPIRGFDVFAEYNRLKGLDKGMDAAHAKGYGVWVAKVVASGGSRRAEAEPAAPAAPSAGDGQREAPHAQEWHVLSGEPQTAELFDREVVRRMGPDFYAEVFAPAIDEAVRRGSSYESIRDTIRKSWTPQR